MIPALKFSSDEPANTAAVTGKESPVKLFTGSMPSAHAAFNILKRILPWLVGAAIIAYLVWQIEYQSLLDAMSRADIPLYGAALAAFVVLNFFADTQNLYAILKHSKNEVPFRDTMIIRGASYLLMIIDYTLGMGSIAYYLHKFKSIPLLRGMGLMFLLNYTTQVSLSLMAIGGTFLAVDAPSPWLARIAVICAALLAFCIIFVAVLKFIPDFKFIKKVKQNDLFKIYIETSYPVYLINISYRCVFYFTFILFFYVAVRAFNIEIPFTALIAYVPVILLIISIPVSAFGLGTSQAAMLVLFKDYGSPAQILAFSLAYSASIILIRGIIGAYYYSIITRRVSNKYKASLLRGEV
jgi:hypothetical protein